MVAFAARHVKKRALDEVTRCSTVLIGLCFCFGVLHTRPAEESIPLRQEAPGRARVVIVEDARSVFAFDPDSEAVEEMVRRGIVAWTGRPAPASAWQSLVSTQDIVGLKVFSSPGADSGTRPAVVSAVVKGLLEAGQPPKQIVIWDKRLDELRRAGFVALGQRLGVQVLGSADEGYDPTAPAYETALLGKLVWGDFEFGKKGDNLGRKSYISKLLTQKLTKIINITPLSNHNLAQVSGALYSLALGSVDNTIRFETGDDAPLMLSQAVPEIYALPQVGDKVVLNIVDALICQYQGEEQTLRHYSMMLGQLRFSSDPVASDVLSIQELERQRHRAKAAPVRVNWQMYTNAFLLELGTCSTSSIDITRVTSSTTLSEASKP